MPPAALGRLPGVVGDVESVCGWSKRQKMFLAVGPTAPVPHVSVSTTQDEGSEQKLGPCTQSFVEA